MLKTREAVMRRINRIDPVEALIEIGLVLMVVGMTLGSVAFACAGSLAVIGPAVARVLLGASRGTSPAEQDDVQTFNI